MKSCIFILVTLFIQTAFSETDHHGHNDHLKVEVALTLNSGQKWSTDQPLRKNMTSIHNHIKARLDKIQNHKLTDADYHELSKKIKGNVDAIFGNCKLTPKADAQLHIVLAGMLSANSKLIGKLSAKEKASAVMDILEHFKAYLKHFNHSKAPGVG